MSPRPVKQKQSTTPATPMTPSSPASSISSSVSNRLSMRSILRKSVRAKQVLAAPNRLPPYVRPLLELYYSKYNAAKLNTGEVDAIYEWAQKVGITSSWLLEYLAFVLTLNSQHSLQALEKQLQMKYLESLEQFADRISALNSDLTAFYEKHDPSKIQQGKVEPILRWAIRNGRAALNQQLRKKYGCDLESKDPSRFLAEEPDF